MRMRNVVRVALFLLVLAGLAKASIVAQARHDGPADARTRMARRWGRTPERVKLLNEARIVHPLTGRRGTEFKALLEDSGEMTGIVLDENGNEVDPAVWEREERRAQRTRYGTLTPSLDGTLARTSPNATLAVDVWLTESADDDGPTRLLHLNGPTAPELHDAVDAEVGAHHDRVVARRLARTHDRTEDTLRRLTALDPSARAVAGTALLSAHLTPAQIRAVSRWPDVDRIYPQMLLDKSSTMFEQDLVANSRGMAVIHQDLGFNGAGVKVADLEHNGAIPVQALGGNWVPVNPYLQPLTQDTTYLCGPADHTIAVVGMIASHHPTYPGVAPGASILVGGTCDQTQSTEMQQQAISAVLWGANIINLSWGNLTNGLVDSNPNDPYQSMARFFDTLVLSAGAPTIVAAAGNRGQEIPDEHMSGFTCSGYKVPVDAPAIGYNVLGVGGYDDGNTIGWIDMMNPCSSHINPVSTHGDREKPDLAAPGSALPGLLNTSPWLGYDRYGTSFASPIVAGTAALMMQAAPSLKQWPEAVRAILMTTALHNIEGSSRLSDADGAGGIYPPAAVDVARARIGNWQGLYYTCSTGDIVTNIGLTAGKRARVAVTWDNDPAYASYGMQPGADLDLTVTPPPTMGSASISASYDNTFEIVDFVAPVTGAYQVKIHPYRCDYSPSWLAWAWYQSPT